MTGLSFRNTKTNNCDKNCRKIRTVTFIKLILGTFRGLLTKRCSFKNGVASDQVLNYSGKNSDLFLLEVQ